MAEEGQVISSLSASSFPASSSSFWIGDERGKWELSILDCEPFILLLLFFILGGVKNINNRSASDSRRTDRLERLYSLLLVNYWLSLARVLYYSSSSSSITHQNKPLGMMKRHLLSARDAAAAAMTVSFAWIHSVLLSRHTHFMFAY